MEDQNQMNQENQGNIISSNLANSESAMNMANSESTINMADPKHYISPEDNKKANIMSGISLACMLLPTIITGVAQGLFGDSLAGIYEEGAEAVEEATVAASGIALLFRLLSSLSGVCFIAAIILIIVVRVKYPANTFGKVLMWIYIVFGIIAAVILIVALVALVIACNGIVESCKSCSSSLELLLWLNRGY